jgi:hypothetical protein
LPPGIEELTTIPLRYITPAFTVPSPPRSEAPPILRHRLNVRNRNPTVKTWQRRTVHYPSYNDSNYFRRAIQELANRYKEEIRVDGNEIRLTRYGHDKTCENTIKLTKKISNID